MNDHTDAVERAWERFCNRGVITPEYASEIAARRAIQTEWATENETLR